MEYTVRAELGNDSAWPDIEILEPLEDTSEGAGISVGSNPRYLRKTDEALAAYRVIDAEASVVQRGTPSTLDGSTPMPTIRRVSRSHAPA